MRTLILIAILSVSLFSCTENNKPDSNNQNTNAETLVSGPIVQESLTKEQLDKITWIQKTFNEVYPVSLEETITNFKRDQNPDNEITIWLQMAITFQAFTTENPGQENLEIRKEAFKLILMRSMMPEKEATQSANLKLLNAHQIQEILKHYTWNAKPIKVERN